MICDSLTDKIQMSESFCVCAAKKWTCTCGEDREVDWRWDNQYVYGQIDGQIILSNDDRDVRFHPGYSSGTAAVRGETPFRRGHHYYWEIKMLTALYGTDVMVGVGTDNVQLGLSAYRFCSMLGLDSESWGYSYRGEVQHGGRLTKYGPTFGEGSIVGVHLDMCAGTIEFFHNRRPLGVAFDGVRGRNLYPMVSSTAARSAVRVVCALSFASNLQFDCLREIFKRADLTRELHSIPGFRSIVRNYWWRFPAATSPRTASSRTTTPPPQDDDRRKHIGVKRKCDVDWTRYIDPDSYKYRLHTDWE